MRTPALIAGIALGAVAVAGCSTTSTTDATEIPADAPSAKAPASTPTSASSSTPTSGVPTDSQAGGPTIKGGVEGTVVRFTGEGTTVDVTLGPDTAATRDFVSLLPFTTRLEEFAGREKIGDLPRRLNVDGTPGSDPQDADLIYFVPWGNLGFYYDTAGIGYSDDTLHLGTYQASEEQLSELEGHKVTVEVVSE